MPRPQYNEGDIQRAFQAIGIQKEEINVEFDPPPQYPQRTRMRTCRVYLKTTHAKIIARQHWETVQDEQDKRTQYAIFGW